MPYTPSHMENDDVPAPLLFSYMFILIGTVLSFLYVTFSTKF